jgi:6,7-dimethyl-8-ribityllumazine synthase
MSVILEGNFEAKGLRIALVASRFNQFVVSKLIEGATDALVRHGASAEDIALAWVPGSLELPFAAARLIQAHRFDAVICLGCVIRGGTDHYQYVAGESIKGIAQLALDSPIPVVMGVLTVDSIDQAVERAGSKMGNKGADAAMTAIEMVNLNLAIDKFLGK